MVEKSINLLETIKKEKNNDLIVFTTFVFDPIFFDGYILRKLKQNNPNSIIIVLMDSKIYSTIENEFTSETGKEYALIPVDGNLFHSKIFLFKSKSKSKVLIGSHNLTLSGITQNLELSFDSDNEQLASDSLEYIASLLRKNLDSKNPWYKRLEPFLKNTKNSILITNEKDSILDQTLNLVKNQTKRVNEIIVFSPYFSKVELIIKKLLDLNPKEIKICVQKNNHNLDTINLKNFTSVSLNEVTPNNLRRLHSKFIVFRSSGKDLILMGSPNFTSPALLETSTIGNYETALLLEEDYELFSKNFKITSITEKDVKNSKRPDKITSVHFQRPQIMINFAYFDDFGRLNIEYKSKIRADVNLFSENEKTNTSISIESGKQTIQVLSVPITVNEIWISKDNKIISNRVRVCSPKVMKIRTGLVLEDSKSVQKVLSEVVSLEDIENILLNVFPQPNERISDYSQSHPDIPIPMPGKHTSHNANQGRFNILSRLISNSSPRNKSSSPPEEGKTGIKHPQQTKEPDESIFDLIKKFTKRFEKEVILKTTITKRYSIYLVIALKLIKKIKTGEIIGKTSESVISGLNSMIVKDTSFSNFSITEKMEILYLLITLANEVEHNLRMPYKFDHKAILLKYKPLILNYLEKENPLESLFQELKQPEKYGFDEIDKNLLKEFLQQEFLQHPILDRLEICKKKIYALEYETNVDKINLGYPTLHLFLSKDAELRNRITPEIRKLKDEQNREAISKILSEYSNS